MSYGGAETPPCRVVTATLAPCSPAPDQGNRSGASGTDRGYEASLSPHIVVGTMESSGRPDRGPEERPVSSSLNP